MMSETKMLAIAFCSSMAMSLMTAGAFYFGGAGPLATAIGATLSSVVTWTMVCLLCLPYVPKPVLEPIREDEDYV